MLPNMLLQMCHMLFFFTTSKCVLLNFNCFQGCLRNKIINNTSNGNLCRKQSNHKTNESMKIGQLVGFFGQLFFFFIGDTSLSKKKLACIAKKKLQTFYFLVKKNFFGQKYFWLKNVFW